MTWIDLYVLALPVIGTLFALAIGRYGTRSLRAETERARDAEREAQQQTAHTTR